MREIFSTSHADARDDVPCIHGVRVLSTLWLAMLHSWTQYRFYGNLFGNPEDVHKLYKVWWFFTFFCQPFGVDTFLILRTDPEESMKIHLEMYFGPWAKTAPFVVGLLLGYTLYRRRQQYILKPMTVCLGWLSSSCACLSVIGVNYYNLKDLYDQRRFNLTDGQASLLEALNKPLWAFGVAWIIFACTVGYGGAVNRLLSWRGWVPLSRLSYSVYLWHNVVHTVISYNNRWETFTLSPWTAIQTFFSSTIIAFGVAILFTLLVEWPALALRRLFCLNNNKGA